MHWPGQARVSRLVLVDLTGIIIVSGPSSWHARSPMTLVSYMSACFRYDASACERREDLVGNTITQLRRFSHWPWWKAFKARARASGERHGSAGDDQDWLDDGILLIDAMACVFKFLLFTGTWSHPFVCFWTCIVVLMRRCRRHLAHCYLGNIY